MLLGIMCALAFMAAVLLCVATGAFDSFGFLWQMPLGFVGAFIVQVALLFAAIVIICKFIDPEKPREKDSPWFRWLIMQALNVVLTVLPVQIRKKGFEKMPKDGRFLLVCNHTDHIDPAILLHCFSEHAIGFVAKRETSQMFLVKQILPKLLCPLINRENDREALKTILRCISLLKNDEVSIGIFPEGRINKYHKLAHFRPGVFKIAQKAQVPIVVCTMQGVDKVLKRALRGRRAVVDVHFLEVIPVEAFAGKTTVDVAAYVYDLMAKDLGPENVLTPEEEENA